MPPRRSSRARTSVEPTVAPSKRKRNEPHDVEDDELEEVKPAPRTRRSASAQPSTTKGRASTRSRKSLEEVQEEEEEDAGSEPLPDGMSAHLPAFAGWSGFRGVLIHPAYQHPEKKGQFGLGVSLTAKESGGEVLCA